jgi:hypothetical protein
MKVTLVCGACAETFSVSPSYAKRPQRFCSRACYAKTQLLSPNRFWDSVDKDGPVPAHLPHLGQCWIWNGCTGRFGYGQFRINGTNEQAHRVAVDLARGGILGTDTWILHACDNPRCVNPGHLREGDHRANMADAVSKGRQARGSRVSNSRLDETAVAEIVRAHASGEAMSSIAHRHRVGTSTVNAILKGRTWRHVTGKHQPLDALEKERGDG